MKRVLAAFMFFTRLPLWRMVEVPSHYFKRVVELWPLTGWLTGGVMALTMWLSAQILPATVAALMAIAARLILTGALHDDGLADFCDGFGGGTSRERILAIMKDSHIGTYGVISLIIYYTLFVTSRVHDAYRRRCVEQILRVAGHQPPAIRTKRGGIKGPHDIQPHVTVGMGHISAHSLAVTSVASLYIYNKRGGTHHSHPVDGSHDATPHPRLHRRLLRGLVPYK